MHKNFFLFEQLIREIKAQILGKHIGLPFTFQKDELIFPLDDQQFLRISVSADHPYILLSPAKHIRQPVLEFFPETEGQPILDMRLKSFDKHAIIELNDFRLEALFYAPYYNVFLFTPDDRLKAQFKDKNEYPPTNEPPASPLILSDLSPAEVQTRLQSESQKTLQSFFKKNFIALNNVLLNEIFYRLDMPKEQMISRISPAQKDKITKTLVQISDELNDEKSYLYFRNEHIERIAVLRLTYLETDSAVRFRSFDSLNAALSAFYRELTFKQEIGKLKNLCLQALQKRWKYLENSLKKLEQSADLEARKQEAELKGNLLLTFKTQIPKGAKEVELENIFSDKHETVKIKLNPAKSVTDNAQKYFNKFKRLNEEKRLHQIRRDTYQKELAEIEVLMSQLEKINDLPRLKKFAQKLKEMKLLQKAPDENPHKIPAANLKYSFRRLILDKKWDVYIGKDGPNNDLLTFRFANKWDIWLHAQGVPGSHVIIHLPKRDQMPPRHVIEQAAQIAAANSKARHASTVPVIYTQARYVSRIRKAPPGTVKVQNEKVLFVKPMEVK